MSRHAFNPFSSRTKRPLPIWIDAFLRDTQHLSADEIGAYFLILTAMWSRESCDFPDDDRMLSRVCRVSPTLWKRRLGPAIRPFFRTVGGMLISKRLREEAGFVEHGVAQQHDRKTGNNLAKSLKFSDAMPTTDNTTETSVELTSQQPTTYIGSGSDARASQTDPPTQRERILKAIGVDPTTGITGHGGATLGTRHDMDLFGRWQSELGLSPETIIAVITEVMAKKPDRRPPNSFRYFNPAMQREAGRQAEPALIPIKEDRQNDQQPSRSRRDESASDALQRRVMAAARVGEA